MRPLREENGLAMPIAMAVMTIVLMLSPAALALGLGSLERAGTDRSHTRALAAADSGADVAAERMNRLLVTAEPTAVLNLPTGVAPVLGCVRLGSVGEIVMTALSVAGWCPESSWEDIEPDTPTRGAEFTYAVSSGVQVVVDGLPRVERRIVATGRVGGSRRRILVRLRLDPDPGNLLSLFRRHRYVECTSSPTGSAPDSGCPS